MFAKTTYHTAWKIISDPIAEERQWLAAAEIVCDKRFPASFTRTAVHERIPDSVHAWLASLLATLGAMGVFFIGFSMFTAGSGILGISDSLTTFADWLSAVFWMIGIPIVGCSMAGYFQRPNTKECAWTWTMPLIPYVTIGVLGYYYRIGWQYTGGILLTGILCGRGAYLLGRALAGWWQSHLPRMVVASPTIPVFTVVCALVWAMIVQVISGNGEHQHVQMDMSTAWTGLQFLGLLTALFASMSAAACNSRRITTSLAAAFTPQLPLMLFYTASLVSAAVYTLGRYFIGPPDPGALAVSAVCLATTTGCTIGGGAAGWAFRRVASK